MNKKTYQELKEKARNKAIDYQQLSSESSFSLEEIIFQQHYFYKLGKRYGLLREFKENGII